MAQSTRASAVPVVVAVSMVLSGSAQAKAPQKAALTTLAAADSKAKTANLTDKTADSTEKSANSTDKSADSTEKSANSTDKSSDSTVKSANSTETTEDSTAKTEDAQAEPAPAPAPAPAVAPVPKDQPTVMVGLPPEKGTGLIIGGAVLAGVVGVPLSLLGLTGLAGLNVAQAGVNTAEDAVGSEESLDTEREFRAARRLIWGGCVIPGVLALAGGTVMIVFGAKRNMQHRQWRNRNQQYAKRPRLSPLVGATRFQTGVYGIQGRF